MEQIYSIGEVGKRLGIQAYRITYAIKTGHLPEVSYRFLGNRCFTEQDIERIAVFYGVDKKQQSRKGGE